MVSPFNLILNYAFAAKCTRNLDEINQFKCLYDLDELHLSELDFNLEDKLLIYFYSLES